jgi:hypothetical protein
LYSATTNLGGPAVAQEKKKGIAARASRLAVC